MSINSAVGLEEWIADRFSISSIATRASFRIIRVWPKTVTELMGPFQCE